MSTLTLIRRFNRGCQGLFVVTVLLLVGDMASYLLPPFFQQIFTDNIITHKNPEWFAPLMVFYVALFVIELAIWTSFSVIRRKSYARIIITLSTKYIWTVFRLPLSLLAQFTAGELVARYTSISKTVKSLDTASPALVLMLVPILCCYILISYSWKLAILEIFAVLMLLYVMRTTSKLQKQYAMDLEVTEARLQNVTMTGMSNLETIKSLGSEQYFFERWEEIYTQSINARVKSSTNTIFLSVVPQLMLQLTNASILCMGAWYVMDGELTPGMILASQGMINEAVFPINRIIESIMGILRAHSSIQRIKDVTDFGQESAELSLPEGDDLPDIAKLTGEIELRDVTFGYDRSLPPILNHFSLKIKAGERIALVGPSGCGKSTVLSLVSGLYEPWEGEVLFDGKPRKDIERMTFVNSVSVINQDVVLFEGTIADNVKMWDESIENFAMVLACNDAQIHHEILERPGAYQGAVMERGKNFSGGQRQRIEIATALAKEPTILLMDEGTSALDPQTEAKLMKHLYDMGMTMIMIAHRLETIAGCDQIYVVEHGRITQHGTHDELRQMDGLYSNLLKYA